MADNLSFEKYWNRRLELLRAQQRAQNAENIAEAAAADAIEAAAEIQAKNRNDQMDGAEPEILEDDGNEDNEDNEDDEGDELDEEDVWFNYLSQLTSVLEAWPRILERRKRFIEKAERMIEEIEGSIWGMDERTDVRDPLQVLDLRLDEIRPDPDDRYYHEKAPIDLEYYTADYNTYRMGIDRSLALENAYHERARRERLEEEVYRVINVLDQIVMTPAEDRRYQTLREEALNALGRVKTLTADLDRRMSAIRKFDPVFRILTFDPEYGNIALWYEETPETKELQEAMIQKVKEIRDKVDESREVSAKLGRISQELTRLTQQFRNASRGPRALMRLRIQLLTQEKAELEGQLNNLEDWLQRNLFGWTYSEDWLKRDYGYNSSPSENDGVPWDIVDDYDEGDDRVRDPADYAEYNEEMKAFARRFGIGMLSDPDGEKYPDAEFDVGDDDDFEYGEFDLDRPLSRWEKRWIMLEDGPLRELERLLMETQT